MSARQCKEKCDCLYKLLGLVKPNLKAASNPGLVRRQYKKFMMLTHPDKIADHRAHNTAVLLNQAVAVLGCSTSERIYRSEGLSAVGQVHEQKEVNDSLEFLQERSNSILHTNECDESPREGTGRDGVKTQSTRYNDLKRNNIDRPDMGRKSPPVTCDRADYDSGLVIGEASHDPLARSTCTPLRHPDLRQSTRRVINRIIDHNIRPKKVWFIVEWQGYDHRERIEAKYLVEHYKDSVLEYLRRLEMVSVRRFEFLLDREPSFTGMKAEVKFGDSRDKTT